MPLLHACSEAIYYYFELIELERMEYDEFLRSLSLTEIDVVAVAVVVVTAVVHTVLLG